LQIPPNPLRPHFVRAVVRIHEYPDGRLAVFHGPHRFTVSGFVRAHTGRAEIWEPIGDALRQLGLPE
jgi:hypothetical protein